MTVKDSHSISSSDTFKSRKLVQTLSSYVYILIFIYLSSETGKAFKVACVVDIKLFFYGLILL